MTIPGAIRINIAVPASIIRRVLTCGPAARTVRMVAKPRMRILVIGNMDKPQIPSFTLQGSSKPPSANAVANRRTAYQVRAWYLGFLSGLGVGAWNLRKRLRAGRRTCVHAFTLIE